jgi:AcrR family transcriptional regulator
MTPPAPARTDGDEGTRPRVEGDREREILEAAIEVLADVGYDRLTMDAVASRARASKATLYRRWQDKATLVVESLLCRKGVTPEPADTGTLRGDLVAAFCGMGGVTDPMEMSILASVLTAIGRDEAFAERFRRDFLGPKIASGNQIFARAMARGEISPDVDLEVIVPALPGIVLHRAFLLGEPPDADLVTRVIDHVIIPALGCGAPTGTTDTTSDSQEAQDRTS